MIVRPMLAARAASEEDIRVPCLATPKLDGIRCLRVGSDALTRSFKRVPNHHIRAAVEQLPEGLDGELIAGSDTTFNFQATSSAVMRRGGEPEFRYWVFDWYDPLLSYEDRADAVATLAPHPIVRVVLPTLVHTREQLLDFEANCLARGFEGVCTRAPGSPYLFGRSKLSDQYLVKLKRYCDSEMRVTGFIERVHNTNKALSDNFGYTKRPGGHANSVPMNTLGSFVGLDVHTGVEVRVGTGMSDSLRQSVWDQRELYLGKLVKYRYQPTGRKDKQRFTSFLWFREEADL